MGAGEFGLWLAFMAEEQIGSDHEADRWGLLMAALHNGPLLRRDKQPWRARSFVRERWPQPAAAQPPSPQADAAALQAMAARMAAGRRKR